MKKRLFFVFSVMFTGHTHDYRNTTVQPHDMIGHTAGYSAAGHVIGVKASTEKGVYTVTHVRLDDYSPVDPGTLEAVYAIPQ